jgi:hypothetical protein
MPSGFSVVARPSSRFLCPSVLLGYISIEWRFSLMRELAGARKAASNETFHSGTRDQIQPHM